MLGTKLDKRPFPVGSTHGEKRLSQQGNSSTRDLASSFKQACASVTIELEKEIWRPVVI